MKLETKKVELSDGLSAMIRAFQLEPLDDEAIYAEFYHNNTMSIRMGYEGDSPVDNLFDDCTTPLGINAHLFSGHRGCGKSTELFDLKRRLENGGHPVCMIRCESEMNLNLADCWDVMLFISEGLYRIIKEYGLPVNDAPLLDLFDYIRQDVEVTDEITNAKNFNMGIALNLFASIKGGLQMGDTQRTTIREKMERRGSEWKRYVDEISARITDEMNGKQPILIFEDFDKIIPSERALDIFRYDTLGKMPFPIIYTFPIDQTYNFRFNSIKGLYKVHVLPMIKVSNMDRSRNDEGIRVIREIIGKRADLQLFEPKALEILIEKTGGVLRHLFECIITASRIANRRDGEKIGVEDVNRATSSLASMLSRFISMADNHVLANIYNEIKYRAQIESSISVLGYMHGLVVLEYQNGERWHDLHPLIADFLRKRGELGGNN